METIRALKAERASSCVVPFFFSWHKPVLLEDLLDVAGLEAHSTGGETLCHNVRLGHLGGCAQRLDEHLDDLLDGGHS